MASFFTACKTACARFARQFQEVFMKKTSFQQLFPAPDHADLAARLRRPDGMTDVILDTDTYNEIDDQFAPAYPVRSREKLRVRAVTAAPFCRDPATVACRSADPADGMEKSGRS